MLDWVTAKRRVLSLAVMAVVVLVPVPAMLRMGGFAMEEGLLLVGGELVSNGKTPNGDFEHLYGPGGLWVLAGAFFVFGVSITVERLVGLAYRVLLLWAIHRIARRYGWGVALAATLVAWVVIAPFGLIAYSWVGALAFATTALAVSLDAEADLRRWLLAGVLAGVALLYRADLIVAVGLSMGLIWWDATTVQRRRLITGAAVGVSPYLIHLATAGPKNVIEGMFIDPVFRLRSGRRLPLPPEWHDSGDFFARVDDLVSGGESIGLDRPAQLAVLFWVVIFAAAAVVVISRIANDRRLFAVGLLVAGTVPQLMQRPSPNHLKFVGLLAFSMFVVALASLFGTRWRGWLVGGGLIAALVLIAPHHIGRFTWDTFVDRPLNASDIDVTVGDRSLPVGDAQAKAEIETVIGALDERAEPGDRVFVGPLDLTRTNYSYTSLYHLLPDYEPGSYHLEMNPGLANRDGGRLAGDVASSDWLLLSDLFDGWSEPNTSTNAGDPRAAATLATAFCEVATTGSYHLFGRCPS